MELDLSPELQAKLDEIAAQRGRDAKSLVKEAIERLVDYDAWFVREVEKGLAEMRAATSWNTTMSAPALRTFSVTSNAVPVAASRPSPLAG